MKINLIGGYLTLQKAGYYRHKTGNGWIRYVGGYGSRFHAKVNEDLIDLHYDKCHGTYHSAHGKEDLLRAEIKRIRRIFHEG